MDIGEPEKIIISEPADEPATVQEPEPASAPAEPAPVLEPVPA